MALISVVIKLGSVFMEKCQHGRYGGVLFLHNNGNFKPVKKQSWPIYSYS